MGALVKALDDLQKVGSGEPSSLVIWLQRPNSRRWGSPRRSDTGVKIGIAVVLTR